MIIINDVNEYKGILGNIDDYESLVQYAIKKKKKNLEWMFREGASLVTQVLLNEIRELNTNIKNVSLKRILDNFEKLVNQSDTIIIVSQE